MAEGRLNRCLSCGLECNRVFLITNGSCRVCAGHPTDPVVDLMLPPPDWVATPKPKLEEATNVWWIFRKTKWIPLAPYEPIQKLDLNEE